MSTDSYPKANGNYTAAQWRNVFDGQTGIVDADGTANTCVDLTLSSTDNTASVTGGKVWYRGFILDIDPADSTSSATLAAATTTPLTYSVGVMHDVPNEATQPLKLWFGLKSAIGANTPAGGSFCSLWEVTRSSGELLSAAARADLRRFLGPSISVLSGPAPLTTTGVSIGSRAFDGVDQWVRVRNSSNTGALWQNLTSPAYTTITRVTAGSNATQASKILGEIGKTPGSRYRLGEVELDGVFERTNGDGFPVGAFLLGTVATAHRPNRTVPVILSCQQLTGLGFNTIHGTVDTAGNLIAFIPSTLTTALPHWLGLAGARYNPTKAS